MTWLVGKNQSPQYRSADPGWQIPPCVPNVPVGYRLSHIVVWFLSVPHLASRYNLASLSIGLDTPTRFLICLITSIFQLSISATVG